MSIAPPTAASDPQSSTASYDDGRNTQNAHRSQHPANLPGSI